MIAVITNLVVVLLWVLASFSVIKASMAMYELLKHKKLDVTDEDGEKYLYWHTDKQKIIRRFFEWGVTIVFLIAALVLVEQKF